MKHIEITTAERSDAEILCNIFINHITEHPEYISHGEIQMGVGEGTYVPSDKSGAGGFISKPSPFAREKWMNYINGKFDTLETSSIFKAAVISSGSLEVEEIAGFCVLEITDDGDAPFGMLCDVLVKEEYRGKGIGTKLIQKSMEWFRSKGIKDIYLESGLGNHAAHAYFERLGFHQVSHIFKLE